MSLVESLHAAHKARQKRIASMAISRPEGKPWPIQREIESERTPDKVIDAIQTVEDWVKRQKERFGQIEIPANGPSIDQIQLAVCRHYGITHTEMLSSRRASFLAFPRQVAVHICRRLTTRSYPEIGRRFNGRDHTTILHSDRKIASLLKTDMSLQASVEMLIEQLGGERK